MLSKNGETLLVEESHLDFIFYHLQSTSNLTYDSQKTFDYYYVAI